MLTHIAPDRERPDRSLTGRSNHDNLSDDDIGIATLSQLAEHNHIGYAAMISMVYVFTSRVCDDYSRYFEWYFDKIPSGVLNGDREVFAAMTDDQRIVGVIIIKKDQIERKICTLLVDKAYRGRGIATELLERSFEWLGTSKPLITMTSRKVKMFRHFIDKYDWKLSRVSTNSSCATGVKELVFNE